ncbi:hypothetical protein BDBG_03921 [Blastomyces gilchristii SLH14081]|uniref:Uncharacterized protein n=1 Tax=Blastomyces gilchristii (strain SLH14081) TaxID=559298 RepID=A0A179UIQ6_BLAGS|nr:uncharacterized protein BDBG_03921 [Blastomyces gilchristii SLH14081]OAT07905.1 hypothetical protein BDBG_03921 [Blastomyces gilchristii SLH14081]
MQGLYLCQDWLREMQPQHQDILNRLISSKMTGSGGRRLAKSNDCPDGAIMFGQSEIEPRWRSRRRGQ